MSVLLKNLVSLILYFVFVSILLISAAHLIISWHLGLLGMITSLFSRSLRCAVKLLVFSLFNFFMKAFSVFILSYIFGYALYSLLLTSKKYFFSLFLSWPIFSFSTDLFSSHEFVIFLLFLLLLFRFSLWWSYKIQRVILIFF